MGRGAVAAVALTIRAAAVAATAMAAIVTDQPAETSAHDWATNPFAPPQSQAPEHVAEMYSGIDHEVLAKRVKVRDAEHAAARSAEAARKAAEDKSPEAFLRGVRSFKPGKYELLFRCVVLRVVVTLFVLQR